MAFTFCGYVLIGDYKEKTGTWERGLRQCQYIIMEKL